MRAASGSLDPGDFVSHTYALDEITEAFRTQMGRGRSLKVHVRPSPDAASGRSGE